ncbi:MAG: DUF29 domain-containing protein [Cyanobacteria bacterium J06554_6]
MASSSIRQPKTDLPSQPAPSDAAAVGQSGHLSAQQLTDLYETDFMAWCEHQAGALSTRSYDQLDLVNLIEEVTDMGREQFNKTKSLTRQIIAHILKLQAFPNDPAVNHWQDEIEAFQDSLDDVVTGSIRYRFEQQAVFAAQQAKALKRLNRKYLETDFEPLKPMTLDELIMWELPQ